MPLTTMLSVRTLSLLLLVSLGLACVPQTARAAKPHGKLNAKQQIEALEEQWRAVTIAGDAAGLDRLLSEDYIGISWTGQVNTKVMQVERLRNRTVVVSQLEMQDVKIKLVDSVAIVTGRTQVVANNEGTALDGSYAYTRVWHRGSSGNWKITSFEATKLPSAKRTSNAAPHSKTH